MLYHLFYSFVDSVGAFNVTRYITFRSMMGLLTALLISFLCSPALIRFLRSHQLGQVVRDDGPNSHLSKAGTPTMGGVLILLAVVLPTLLWMDLKNPYVWLCLLIFTTYGLLGFIDDYLKITQKSSDGLSARHKLLWQILIALTACIIHYQLTPESSILYFPFFKDLSLDLGLWYIPFSVIVIIGASNAVNLTDGLDGLAIGPVMTSAACFTIFSYVSGNAFLAEYLHFPFIPFSGEMAVFSAALIGAGMGFLWYNTYPAQVFMGDVGSLPLGGALGALAVFSKHEILLAVVGGIFVLEAVSVITQVSSFKLTGRRVFRMAPLHHHFELKGWAEPKIIVRFWIISIILALFGLLSLKLR